MAISTLVAASSRLLANPADLDDANALVRLTQASAAVERYCGRIFAQQTYRETFPARGTPTLLLRHTPVIALDVVSIGTTVLAADEYTLESPDSGILTLLVWSRGWTAAGVTWITVDYTAGYLLPLQLNPPEPSGEELPEDLSMATLAWAGGITAQQATVAAGGQVQSKTFGLTGDKITFSTPTSQTTQTTSTPTLAADLLAPYRRWKVA